MVSLSLMIRDGGGIRQSSQFKIQTFEPKKHKRDLFSCGVGKIDNYIKRTAKKHTRNNVERIRVIVDSDEQILGYCGVVAQSIPAKDVPLPFQNHAGKNGLLPAALITMLGVDQQMQNKKIGKLLLVDALGRINVASEEIGICCVIVDIVDGGDVDEIKRREAMRRVIRFYEEHSFEPLPNNKLRMFLPIKLAREAREMVKGG